MKELVARIKAENGNYIGISSGEYGKYVIVWCNKNMEPIKYATLSDWVWATTWGNELESGLWKIPDTNYNVYVDDDIGKNAIFPVKLNAEITRLDNDIVLVNVIGTDTVYVGNIDEDGNFTSNISTDEVPYNINGVTTSEVWAEILLDSSKPLPFTKTIYFRDGLPNPLTELERLAINRLLKDKKSSYMLLDMIHAKENDSYSADIPAPFLEHDSRFFNIMTNLVAEGDYSLLYSLIYKIPEIDQYSKNRSLQRCTFSYYRGFIWHFIYNMTEKELERMFENAEIFDMDSIIYLLIKTTK